MPFVNFSDLIVQLKKTVNEASGRNYFFIYWDKLDTLEHTYGPSDESCRVELSKINYLLNSEFINKIESGIASETLLIITADHGQISVIPADTIDLCEDKLIIDSLENDENVRILPTGSARDVFLHIKKDRLGKVLTYLREKLSQWAEVIETEEAIKFGLFGGEIVNTNFGRRLGNVIILPFGNRMVWRKVTSKDEFKHKGHHGGLTKEEMLIPFSIHNLNELKSKY